MNEIETLAKVIKELHGADATHRESVPIKEVWQGQTVWDGVVEVFDLHGAKAPKAYAWSHETDDPENPRRYVAVLHVPPATSPLDAVRVAIVQEFRNAQAGQAASGKA